MSISLATDRLDGEDDLVHRLHALTGRLRAVRDDWRDVHGAAPKDRHHGFPSRHALSQIIDMLGSALFPMRLGPGELSGDSEDAFVQASLESAISLLAAQIRMEVAARQSGAPEGEAMRIAWDVAERLPEIRRLLDTDVEAAFIGDPAATSRDEVLLCYPCITAMIHHRIAHALYGLGAVLVARIIAEVGHSRTGIDIHPGARIGESFFIDHGTGVVIGQTAIIGDRVRLYQAVTLGARRFRKGEEGKFVNEPRHPILEDDVTIYAGATILGRVIIGKGSVIGGNVWLTRSVPAGSRVRQVKASVAIEASDPCD